MYINAFKRTKKTYAFSGDLVCQWLSLPLPPLPLLPRPLQLHPNDPDSPYFSPPPFAFFPLPPLPRICAFLLPFSFLPPFSSLPLVVFPPLSVLPPLQPSVFPLPLHHKKSRNEGHKSLSIQLYLHATWRKSTKFLELWHSTEDKNAMNKHNYSTIHFSRVKNSFVVMQQNQNNPHLNLPVF